MVMVEELGENVRVLRDQCRRLQDDFPASPTQPTASSASSSSSSSAAAGTSAAPSGTLPAFDRAGTRDFAQRHAASAAVPTPPPARAAGGERLPLDENDLRFNSAPLLHILLTEAAKRSQETIEEAAAAPAQAFNSHPKPLPSVKLLVLVQRDLYRKASMAATAKEPIVATFIDYVRRLLEHCHLILHRLTSSPKHPASIDLDSPLSQALYRSLIGSALPITITTLHSLLFKPPFTALALSVFPVLQLLLSCLDVSASLYPSSRPLDRADSSRLPMSSTNLRVVESPHSYLPSTDEESIITIPGADYLSLDFDPRCSTERGRDILDVLNANHELVTSLDGDHQQWPQTPLVVPGSSVVLKFHAESVTPTMRFGYRITVRGMTFPTPPPAQRLSPSAAADGKAAVTTGEGAPEKKDATKTEGSATAATTSSASGSGSGKASKSDLLAEGERGRLPSPSKDPLALLHTNPFILDLLNSVSRLFGKCARLLIAGESVSAEEKGHVKWLSSPLFSQGFEKDHPSAEVIVTVPSLPEPPPALPAVEPVRLDARIATTNNVNASSNIDSTNNSPSSTSTSSTSSSAASAEIPPMDAALSIGSGVDATFLAGFIDATPDSAGAKLELLMKKLVRPTGPELMGGVHVKRAVRCFVAALLKHLSLAGEARKFVEQHAGELQGKTASSASSSSSTQLVDAFKKGGLMHRWIISQRQSLQQLHVAKMQQLEGEGKPMTAEQVAAVERRLEYGGFCAPLFNKALYLLSVRPCLTHPASRGSHLAATPGLKLASEVSSTLAMTRTLSNEVQLVRSNSSGGRARDGAESFLSLFSVYKTLQHFNLYKRAAERHKRDGEADKADDNIVDLLALFVQSDTPVSKFGALISAQSQRAVQRLTAIEAVLALLHSLHFTTATLGLLSNLSNPFRAFNAYPVAPHQEGAPDGQHYYAKIESCDFRLRKRVRSAFLALYRQLAGYIKDEQQTVTMRALALDAWAIEWIPLDHPELIDVDILRTLHHLAGSSSQPLLKSLAAQVLKLLLAAQMRFEVDSLPTIAAGQHAENSEEEDSEQEEEEEEEAADDAGVQPTRSSAAAGSFVNQLKGPIRLDRLQQQIVDRVFTDLFHSFHWMIKVREQIGALGVSDTQLEQQPPSSTLASQYLTAESSTFSALSTLIAISSSSTFALHYLESKNTLQLLLSCLAQGSPRVQRTALNLLAQLLRRVSPHQLTAMKLTDPAGGKRQGMGKFSQPVTSASLLTYLFHSIGILTYGDIWSSTTGEPITSSPLNPYDHRTGDVHLSLAASMIMHLRALLKEGQREEKEEVDSQPEEEQKMKAAEEEVKLQRRIEHKPSSHSNSRRSWADEILLLMTTAFQHLPSLSASQLTSFQLDSSLPQSMSSPASFSPLLLTIAGLSILGGYSDRIRVGSHVQTVSASTSSHAAKEVGVVVYLDRNAGRVKVLFEHSPQKVIECDLTKLRSSSAVPADSSLLLLYPVVLAAFTSFIESLQRENRVELMTKQRKVRERAEEERKAKEEAETARRRDREAAVPIQISDQPWQCDVCTYVNASSLRAVCDMCTSPNPLASALTRTPKQQVPATPQRTPRALTEGAEKEEVETRVARTTVDDLLYHALRSRALKALCHLLQHGASSAFLGQSQLLPNLLSLATRPTQMDGFMSIAGLEQREERLLELLMDKSHGLVNDQQRFAERAKGTVLPHSPFKSLTVLLPNSFELGSSRAISFLTDDCCTVQFSRPRLSPFDSAKDLSVTVIRSNHLVPNSLPAYYFEVTVTDLGHVKADSSSFNLAIGLLREGMALKGYPGSQNSYAYASRGDVMSTTGGRVAKKTYGPAFVSGDVIGCLWNLRRKMILFTHNGRLIDGNGGTHPASFSLTGKAEVRAAFEDINGRFHPACWLESDQQTLRVNWGQEPFRFDFLSTLPLGYLTTIAVADTAAADVAARPRTAAEIKRRTMAEELKVISTLPIDLCEIALEQKGDDFERAVHYLLESGAAELERLSQEAMRQSQQMEDERKTRVLGVNDGGNDDRADDPSDDEEDLADWLTSANPSNPHLPDQSLGGGAGGGRGWGGGWPHGAHMAHGGHVHGLGQQISAQAAAAASSRRPPSSSSPASMLDDEIEQDIPVGVELPINHRQQAQSHPLSREEAAGGRRPAVSGGADQTLVMVEQVKLDDLSCGFALTVSENACSIIVEDEETGESELSEHILPLSRFLGRTGIVAAINASTRSVQLLFHDADMAVKHARWFPITTLSKPQRLWLDPCQELSTQPWRHAAYAFVCNEQALSVRKVRTAILRLLGSWPSSVPFTLQQLGGSSAVIDMLKLSASELLSSNLTRREAANSSASSQLLQAFQSKLTLLVNAEVEHYTSSPSSLPSVRLNESMYHEKGKERMDLALAEPTSGVGQALLPRIVEEIILHFIQAVNHPTPTLSVKSPHPYPSHYEARERLYIPGASKLLVSFDPACDINEDMLTRLTFYRDSSYQDAITSCQGRYGSGHGRWMSFIVSGDRVYYKFTSGNNTEHWGYKFRVQPIDLRIDDEAALQGLNFELGSWMFEFFLTSVPAFVLRFYAVDLYDSIVWYVIHAKPSAKSRGVELLVRFLLHMHGLEEVEEEQWGKTRPLQFSKLQPLSNQMNQLLDQMSESDYRGGLSSPALQGLIELLATTDLVRVKAASVRDKEKQWLKEEQRLALVKGDSFDVKEKERGAKEEAEDGAVDVAALAVYHLRIVHASYGILNSDSQTIDVTDTLQRYVDELGGSQLYIPFSSALLHQLLVDPAPSVKREKKLQLKYAIVRSMYLHELHSILEVQVKEVEKVITIPANPYNRNTNTSPGAMIKPVPSPFDSVVELSRFTLQMQQGNTFAADVMQEVVRADAIAKSFYPLIPAEGVKFEERTRKGVVDASGSVGAQFTVMMWLYLPDTTAATSILSPASSGSSASAASSQPSSGSSSGSPTPEASSADAVPTAPALSPPDVAGPAALSPSSSSASLSPSGSFSSAQINRRGGPREARPLAVPVAASSSSPLRCVLQKGNYNAELALSATQSGHWSHAASHLHYSGFTLTLGPASDHRLTFSLYTFRHPPQQVTTTKALPTNQWCHVAVTVTRHLCRVIVDGVEDGQRRLQGYRKLSPDPFFFGQLPVGSFDLSEEKFQGSNKGPGLEDEGKRVGITATLKDARFIGYAMEMKEVAQYVRGVTRHNPAFAPSQPYSTVQPVWRDKKDRTKDRGDKTPTAAGGQGKDEKNVTSEGGASTEEASSSSSSNTSEESSTGSDRRAAAGGPPLLFSSGPRCSLPFIRRETLHRTAHRFTAAMDSQLIEYITSGVEAEQHKQRATGARDAPPPEFSTSLLELQPYSPSFPLDAKSLQSYHLINTIPFNRLRSRFVAIQTVNSKLSSVLPLVDFSQAGSSWSLAHRLSAMSWLILREVKTRAWASILRQTGNAGTTTCISVNRPRALRAREKGDLSGMKSVFGQIYRQLHFIRPALLRTDQRPWRVTFEGEGGTDAGGLFRDSISHLSTELQSSAIPLFIQCPNAHTRIGDNQEKWIPNPAATTSIHLSMFSFVGKLMGIAIRGGHMLNLDLPSLVFRPLVGQPITRADLVAVDALSFDVLDKMTAMTEADADQFTDSFALTFTTVSSDGREIELKEGGKDVAVTWANRLEYVQLVEAYRLQEFAAQVAAIKKGLGTIVPVQLLPLFTAGELEAMICGKREISIDYLRANTRYRSPISSHDRHVQMLWDVLTGFSHEERQLFIRFVWGQSRLPYNPNDFVQKFELWPHPVNNDSVLPVSHTCKTSTPHRRTPLSSRRPTSTRPADPPLRASLRCVSQASSHWSCRATPPST